MWLQRAGPVLHIIIWLSPDPIISTLRPEGSIWARTPQEETIDLSRCSIPSPKVASPAEALSPAIGSPVVAFRGGCAAS